MRDKAKEMYESGYGSLKKIAEELGVSENTVKSWKTRDKWLQPKNKKGAPKQKKVAPKVEKVAKEIIEILSESELSEKQRLFCINYIKNFNATQAAIKAGYSRETAMEQGCRLLRNVKVKEYLTELKEMYAREDYLETKRILERHKQIAFADFNDYVDDDENDFKKISETDGTLIKKMLVRKTKNSQGESYSMSIEVEDRAKSLEFLTKFYGLDTGTEIQKQKLDIDRKKTGVDDKSEEKVVSALERLREVLDNE